VTQVASGTPRPADTIGPGTVGLVHLVWAPLGPQPLRAFLRSYSAHPPGIDHELVIVLNPSSRTRQAHEGGAGEARPDGLRGAGRRRPREVLMRRGLRGRRLQAPGEPLTHAALLAELAGVEHRLLVLDRPALDLAAYGLAARALPHRRLCFLNSYSVVLADRWLSHLARALDEPDVGLVGATASCESQAEWIRGRARHWPYQLALLRRARRDYPRFPNPHIRTTAFIAERAAILRMGLDAALDKRSTYLLESGRRSITRQTLERGLRAVVAGRDGRVYGVKDWSAARTYRSGEQDNLLVADRRTRDWQTASPRLRRRLSRDAWGAGYLEADRSRTGPSDSGAGTSGSRSGKGDSGAGPDGR